MNVGLIDVDSHNFPNIALMKISAWNKKQGHNVSWAVPLMPYDLVYQSKVFSDEYSQDIDYIPLADEIIKGGAGYDKSSILPEAIEHCYPDYGLYPEFTKDTAYGYLTRGCPRGCPFCIVQDLEGKKSHQVAELDEFWRGQKNITLLDPNILAFKGRENLLKSLAESKAYVDFNQGIDIRLVDKDAIRLINDIKIKQIHFAWDDAKKDLRPQFEFYKSLTKHKPKGSWGMVYCLVNYDSTMEENLYRIYTLRDMGFDPYVMVYDKPNASKNIKDLQRWCNNKWIFKSCTDFNDYKKGV